MIKIPIVHYCPYTESGQGVAHISHEILAILAGAVHDDEEWLAFFTGTRSADGLTVNITGLLVPEQTRAYTSCETVNKEDLPPSVVGVVHSHHRMGAFFSGTDDKELNPRFPISIVVAQPKDNASAEAQLLGFEYKGEGRAALPCGTIGIIPFVIQPAPIVEDWPLITTAQYGTPKNVTLYYCPHTHSSQSGMMVTETSKCGVSITRPRKAFFGKTGEEFMKEVVKNTKRKVWVQPQYLVNDKRYPYQEGWSSYNDEDTFLRHWGHCGE